MVTSQTFFWDLKQVTPRSPKNFTSTVHVALAAAGAGTARAGAATGSVVAGCGGGRAWGETCGPSKHMERSAT